MKVRVMSGEVFRRDVKSQRTGKSYVFRDQLAVVVIGEQSSPFKLALAEDQAPYAPGEYTVLDASFYVDRDNKLAVGKLALRPVEASQKTAGGVAAGAGGR